MPFGAPVQPPQYSGPPSFQPPPNRPPVTGVPQQVHPAEQAPTVTQTKRERRHERRHKKRINRRVQLQKLETNLVLRLRKLRTGRDESSPPQQPLSAPKELRAVALQSQQAVRKLAQDAARTAGVAAGRHPGPLQSRTTRRAVHDIGSHPVTATKSWWRRF
jgi:hypothetical protein